MKELNIAYNPYLLKTNIFIDGKQPREGSELFGKNNIILQNWIHKLPIIIEKEFNNDEIHLNFIGSKIDYDDIEEILSGLDNVKLIHTDIKYSVEERYEIVKQIFKKLKSNKILELTDNDLLEIIDEKYKEIYDDNFRIAVVANVSAGKSTLINALLHKKILPSKTGECTSQVTYITDNDKENISAIAYSKNKVVKKIPHLTFNTMRELNDDALVSKNANIDRIEINCDIPFVKSDLLSLQIIDTPGRNGLFGSNINLLEELLKSQLDNSMVLFIIETLDQQTIEYLKKIKSIVKESSKSVKDKLIFALNKQDNIQTDTETIQGNTDNIKEKIEELAGIESPKVFPVTAQMACHLYGDDEDDKSISCIKMNKEALFMEKSSPLSKSDKLKIEKMLSEAETKEEKALIHTGVISLELDINTYLKKYALTEKIRKATIFLDEEIKTLINTDEAKIQLNESSKEKEKINKKLKELKSAFSNVQKLKDDLLANAPSSDAYLLTKKEESLYYSAQKRITPIQEYINNMLNGEDSISEYTFNEEILPKLKEVEGYLQECSLELENLANEKFKSCVTDYENAISEQIKKTTADVLGKDDNLPIDNIQKIIFEKNLLNEKFINDAKIELEKIPSIRDAHDIKSFFKILFKITQKITYTEVKSEDIKRLLGRYQAAMAKNNEIVRYTVEKEIPKKIESFLIKAENKYENIRCEIEEMEKVTSNDKREVEQSIKALKRQINTLTKFSEEIKKVTEIQGVTG